jgi:chromate transporter
VDQEDDAGLGVGQHSPSSLTPVARSPSALREVGALFFKLGCIAFGGPAAHIAMMREEVVRRRGWLDDQRFLDLVGAANLIPGPTSTELAIHIGYLRGGRRGLVLAGAAFILPAVLIVLALAWAYTRFGTRPAAESLLYGVKPVIIAVVAQALWSLSRAAVKGPLTGVTGLSVLVLALAGGNEIVLLFAAGLLVMLAANRRRFRPSPAGVTAVIPLTGALGPFAQIAQLTRRLTDGSSPPGWTHPMVAALSTNVPGWAGALAAANGGPVSLGQLFLFFLKVGSVLFGSGYVLLAFLRADLVDRWGWLTDQQLIDAIAIGQFTPGPVFTTATFIGYVVAGLPGAILATVGIFLPAFVFVGVSHPFIPRLRRSPWAGAFLDGVNAASLGLMAAVAWLLGRAAIVDPLTAILAVGAAIALLRTRINSAWLVLGGGIVGLVWKGLA